MTDALFSVWLMIAVLVGVIGLVLIVSKKSKNERSDNASSVDIEIYKDQLKTVKQDLESGLLAPSEAQALENDIARRLIRASDRDQAGSPTDGRLQEMFKSVENSGYFAVVLISVLGAIFLYIWFGSPSLPGQAYALRKQTQVEDLSIVEQQLDEISASLSMKPQDAEMWSVLGKRYMELYRFEKSERSFRRAIEAGGASAALWNSVGTSIVFRDQGEVGGDAVKAFRLALSLEPDNGFALYFVGLNAVQNENWQEAHDYLEQSLASSLESDPWIADLHDKLAIVKDNVKPSNAESKLPAQEKAGVP